MVENREKTMKKILFAGAFALLATPVLAGDPVLGTWKTAPDDNGHFGYVSVKQCGKTICGKLTKAFDDKGKEIKSDNVGKSIIWDMVAQGGGAYGDGKIWSPDRDKTYSSKMQLKGNKLKVKGCIAFICRDGGTWTRVK